MKKLLSILIFLVFILSPNFLRAESVTVNASVQVTETLSVTVLSGIAVGEIGKDQTIAIGLNSPLAAVIRVKGPNDAPARAWASVLANGGPTSAISLQDSVTPPNILLLKQITLYGPAGQTAMGTELRFNVTGGQVDLQAGGSVTVEAQPAGTYSGTLRVNVLLGWS